MNSAPLPGEGCRGDRIPDGSPVRHHVQSPVRIVPEDHDSLLVVAPHPDDETIGAAGLIHAMVKAGRRVRVVIVSDGAGSHPGSLAYPPNRLAALRESESVAALARLGLERADICFCGFPDGQSARWHSDPHAIARLADAVSGAYDLICLPAADDNHADHRKARELALAFIQGTGLTLDYLVWPAEPELRAMLPATTARAADYVLPRAAHAAKIAAMRCYRSQLGLITDDPTGFTIDAPTFARFTAPVERFALHGQP